MKRPTKPDGKVIDAGREFEHRRRLAHLEPLFSNIRRGERILSSRIAHDPMVISWLNAIAWHARIVRRRIEREAHPIQADAGRRWWRHERVRLRAMLCAGEF